MTVSSTKKKTAIDDLPSEVICKILELAVHSARHVHPAHSLAVYSSISHAWRSLCFNSSELWTDIRIFQEAIHEKSLKDWTQEWLDRSYPRPVDISIDIPEFCEDDEDVLEVIQGQLSRIRSLRICRLESNSTGHHFIVEALLTSLSNATNLEHFEICFSPVSSLRMDHILHAGIVLPKLRSQTITADQIVFPLERLISLDVYMMLPTEDLFRQMTCMCPGLEHLTLRRFKALEHPLAKDAPPIHMPSLRSLNVSFYRAGWGSPEQSVLSILAAPELQSLQITGDPWAPDMHTVLPPLAYFPNLHTLRLENLQYIDPMMNQTLIDPTYFHKRSSVRHLELISTSGETLFPEQSTRPKATRRSRSIGREPPEPSSPFTYLGDRSLFRHRELGVRGVIRDMEVTLPSYSTVGDDPLARDSGGNASATTESLAFPCLDALSLDTIRAQDVLWLCELVAIRPGIKRVYLSKSAMRHLLSSFTMESAKAEGKETKRYPESGTMVTDDISPATVVARVKNLRPNRFHMVETKNDGFKLEEWLRARVEVYEKVDSDC
ncbi:hypothetical protein VKT23_008076 [Stygiomarasmius scandens]|uniref:F-box domain-containing protein n=1 Tax=Marasmiellus scandens TaxID=2682957 RepID=A0ABR1JLR8_9AGAR